MTKDERLSFIQIASMALDQVAKSVCPACAKNEVFYCEVVDGEHLHAQSGVCKASPILELMSHMDDVRHQFANNFNEEEEPRVLWGIKGLPQVEKAGG